MTSFEEFTRFVTDAYEHLYDLVYLRSHPITALLAKDADLNRRDQAWQVHHLLLDVIQELDPGTQAPPLSREWRRHRLMILRYVDGLAPQAVADQLAISRRHFYRSHEAALEAMAGILWSRVVVETATVPASPVSDTGVNRLELLRLEAARLSQTERFTGIRELIEGVLGLLDEKIRCQALSVEVDLPRHALNVTVDRQLLRQLLLAMFGYLVDLSCEATTLKITGEQQEYVLQLSCAITPALPITHMTTERLTAIEELATLLNIALTPFDSMMQGFTIRIPIQPQPTILVIDDNEDILTLFQRYLSEYHVVTANSAQRAMEIAAQLKPFAITLDLMMPDQDGWDLLQTFLHHPDIQGTPIIVCSVLRQKELALSLGATAFLEKPVAEEALLNMLAALQA